MEWVEVSGARVDRTEITGVMMVMDPAEVRFGASVPGNAGPQHVERGQIYGAEIGMHLQQVCSNRRHELGCLSGWPATIDGFPRHF